MGLFKMRACSSVFVLYAAVFAGGCGSVVIESSSSSDGGSGGSGGAMGGGAGAGGGTTTVPDTDLKLNCMSFKTGNPGYADQDWRQMCPALLDPPDLYQNFDELLALPDGACYLNLDPVKSCAFVPKGTKIAFALPDGFLEFRIGLDPSDVPVIQEWYVACPGVAGQGLANATWKLQDGAPTYVANSGGGQYEFKQNPCGTGPSSVLLILE